MINSTQNTQFGSQRITRGKLAQDENNETGKEKKLINKHVTAKVPLKSQKIAAKRPALTDVSNIEMPKARSMTKNARIKANNPDYPLKQVAPKESEVDDHMSIDEESVVHHEKEEKQRKASSLNVVFDDIDTQDHNDPLMLSHYVKEIMEYLRDLELKTMVHPMYMDMQPEIKWEMRSVLIDWMVEVHCKLKLLPETLFLSVNFVDRFLSTKGCSVSKLQLVGIVSLLIASKYEEIVAPSISNFVYLSANGYKDVEIIDAERYVLKALGFNLGTPNHMVFLRRISKAEDYDHQTRTVGKYLMEITLLDHRFLCYPPSLIAAAAIWFARKILNRGEWNGNMIHYSGYTEEEIIPVANLMAKIAHTPTKCVAIYKKYSSRKYLKVSTYVANYVSKMCQDF